jgi:hypothetical protein
MVLVSEESTGTSTLLSKVPTVKELCELLGLQRTALKDRFIYTVEATSDGHPATKLLYKLSSDIGHRPRRRHLLQAPPLLVLQSSQPPYILLPNLCILG